MTTHFGILRKALSDYDEISQDEVSRFKGRRMNGPSSAGHVRTYKTLYKLSKLKGKLYSLTGKSIFSAAYKFKVK